MALLGALEAIRSGTTLVLEEGADLEDYAAALADTGLRLLLCERAWDRAGTSIGEPGAVQGRRGAGPRASLGPHRRRCTRAGTARRDGRMRVGARRVGARHVLARAAGDLRALQGELDMIGHHPSEPDLGRGRGGAGAARHAADRVPGRRRIPVRPAGGRALPLHGAAEEERSSARPASPWRSTRPSPRGAASPRASHDLEQPAASSRMGTDNMAEDMVEVCAPALFMERVRREDGRQPTPEQALRWATRNGYRALGVPTAAG